MGSLDIRVGQWYSSGVGFEEVVWQCERWRCGHARLRVGKHDGAKQSGWENAKRPGRERERESGKGESKVMIWTEERNERKERKWQDVNFLGLKLLFSDVVILTAVQILLAWNNNSCPFPTQLGVRVGLSDQFGLAPPHLYWSLSLSLGWRVRLLREAWGYWGSEALEGGVRLDLKSQGWRVEIIQTFAMIKSRNQALCNYPLSLTLSAYSLFFIFHSKNKMYRITYPKG